MTGTLIKACVGALLIAAAARMGDVAQELLGRARESVQASELAILDGHLAAWVIEQKRSRPPRDQAHFEVVVRGLFTARGGRDVTRDRWGEPYVYEHVHDRPVAWRITSKGPDKTLDVGGRGDDLVLTRTDDVVELNQDPTKIIAGALAQGGDERLFADLSRAASKAGPPVEAFAEGAPIDGARPGAAERAELAALDALLTP